MMKKIVIAVFFILLTALTLWLTYSYLFSSWASVASMSEIEARAWRSKASWYGYAAIGSVVAYAAIALYVLRKRKLRIPE